MAGRVNREHMRALIVALCAVRVLGHGRMTLPAARNMQRSIDLQPNSRMSNTTEGDNQCMINKWPASAKDNTDPNKTPMGGPDHWAEHCGDQDGTKRNADSFYDYFHPGSHFVPVYTVGTSDSSRQEHAGDTFPIQTAMLKSGSVIEVELEISAKHQGFFEFSLCLDARSNAYLQPPIDVQNYLTANASHYDTRAVNENQQDPCKQKCQERITSIDGEEVLYNRGSCDGTDCFFRCESTSNTHYFVEIDPTTPCLCTKKENDDVADDDPISTCYNWDMWKNSYNDAAVKQCFEAMRLPLVAK